MSRRAPARRVSLRRTIRQIETHKRAILKHRDALMALRSDLEYIDAFVDGAHRSLQAAIN